MQITLEELKRKTICPILYQNNWDYNSSSSEISFFSHCIREMMGWFYRRGRRLSYEVLCPIVSRLGNERGLGLEEIVKIQISLKNFTGSKLYSTIEQPIINFETFTDIGSNCIKHITPCLSTYNEKACIITWEDSIYSREDLMQSWETRLMSIWSFYVLNRNPTFYNLRLDWAETKVTMNKFTPNQAYIMDTKEDFLSMEDLITARLSYQAPLEICRKCDRRDECLTTELRRRKKSLIAQ